MSDDTAGGLGEADLRRLQNLKATLDRSKVRYVDYHQAEEAAETLAARILEHIPRQDLDGWVFAPIPRGGLLVAGMVSYLLDLSPEQVVSINDQRSPMVLVDDVALTGSRLRRTIEGFAGGELIVAHLASTPELRTAVEADDRVRACVAAIDLEALDAGESVAARELWRERLSDDRYWYGYPELIAFPWSEPDQMLWDPVAENIEKGWNLVSPEKTLKARGSLGPPSEDRSNRGFRFPLDIAFGSFDDGHLICRLDTEEVFRLDGVAAAMWGALGTLGDVEAVVAHLPETLEADPAALRADVPAFADRFVESGILERAPEPG